MRFSSRQVTVVVGVGVVVHKRDRSSCTVRHELRALYVWLRQRVRARRRRPTTLESKPTLLVCVGFRMRCARLDREVFKIFIFGTHDVRRGSTILHHVPEGHLLQLRILLPPLVNMK